MGKIAFYCVIERGKTADNGSIYLEPGLGEGGGLYFIVFNTVQSSVVVLLFVLLYRVSRLRWDNVLVVLLSNRKMYFYLLIFNFKRVKVVAL